MVLSDVLPPPPQLHPNGGVLPPLPLLPWLIPRILPHHTQPRPVVICLYIDASVKISHCIENTTLCPLILKICEAFESRPRLCPTNSIPLEISL